MSATSRTTTISIAPKTHETFLNLTAQEITWAKEAGFLKPETLTGSTSAILGNYRNRVMRDINLDVNGVARAAPTSLAQEKLTLLTQAQDALAELARLERCVNTDQVAGKIRFYKAKLKELTGDNLSQHLVEICNHDLPIKEFIKHQTLAILTWLSQANRELVGKTGNFMWGDFNNFVEDGIQHAKDYQFPLSVQPSAEHDLRLEEESSVTTDAGDGLTIEETGPQKTYAVRASDYMGAKAHDENELRSLLRYLKYKHHQEERPDTHETLPRWKSGKWNLFNAWRRLTGPDQPWNDLGLIGNIWTSFVKLNAYAADSLVGFFSGLILGKPFDWFRKKHNFQLHKNDKDAGCSPTELQEQEILNSSIRTSVMNKVGSLMRRGGIQLGLSIWSIPKNLWGVAQDLWTEIRLSTTGSTTADFNSIVKAQLSQSSQATLNPVGPRTVWEASAQESKGTEAKSLPLETLQISHPLDPYENKDLLGMTVSGLKGFVDLFGHNIYAKHPTLGLLFTLSYGMGLLPLIAPKLGAHLLSKEYVHFIQTMKEVTDKGDSIFSKAGVSFLNAKLNTAGFELISDGFNSWTVKGLNNFRQDPATASAVIMMAYLGGHFYTHANLDGHSFPGAHTLAEETGSVPAFTEAFVGAKLFTILFGMFSSRAQTHETLTKKDIDLAVAQAQDESRMLGSQAGSISPLLDILKIFHQLPTLSHREKAVICDHIGGLYGFNSEISRLIQAKCNETAKESYATRSIKHLFDYVGTLIRLPVAFGFMLGRLWCMDRKEATRPLRRVLSHLKDLLIDSYARVSTATVGVLSVVGSIFWRGVRVATGIAHRCRTVGSALLTRCRELMNKESHVDQEKVDAYARVSLSSHWFAESLSNGTKACLGVHVAQAHSQVNPSLGRFAHIFGPTETARQASASKSRGNSMATTASTGVATGF